MANRHLSRSVALQSLFEWDFNGYNSTQVDAIIDRNVAEFAPGLDDPEFTQALVWGVIKKQAKLDLIISKAAPEWPIEQIAMVDRNVLRLGLHELLFSDKKEVPARVAINEAIEIAKTFGGENSGKFVNGVLGAIYKEMGEPGKDEVPAKKRRPKDVPYEEMPIERLGGAVISAREHGQIYLALVHDIFGFWTLSKGHINPGEEVEAGAKREIKEELALEVNLGAKLGDNEYVASDPEKGKIRKQVSYFLAEAADKNQLQLAKSGGLNDARWFHMSEVADLKMYDDIVPFITKAIKILTHAVA